jgi:cell division protein FtsB
MKSNFDTKNLIIIVISIVAIFLLITYFYGSSGYKKVIKMYEEKALELEKKRDELREQVEYFKEEAKKYYGECIPILITDGIRCYKIEYWYLVHNWGGILFIGVY